MNPSITIEPAAPVRAPQLDWAAPFERLAVGAAFETGERAVSEADVLQFAELTGDHHPLHVDREWAAQGPFGERIAHGLLVVGLAAGLVPFDPSRVLALRAVRDVVFKRPVGLGERVRVRGHVAVLKALSDQAGLVTFSWTVLDSADRAVCRAQVEVLWQVDA